MNMFVLAMIMIAYSVLTVLSAYSGSARDYTAAADCDMKSARPRPV